MNIKEPAPRSSNDELLEKLAELEHDQWIKWSREIAKRENISPKTISRWTNYWVPYCNLVDDVKEFDRVWARKVLETLKPKIETLEAALHEAREALEESVKRLEYSEECLRGNEKETMAWFLYNGGNYQFIEKTRETLDEIKEIIKEIKR